MFKYKIIFPALSLLLVSHNVFSGNTLAPIAQANSINTSKIKVATTLNTKTLPNKFILPSLTKFPIISLAEKKVIQAVGFSFDTGELIAVDPLTGRKIKSCGKLNFANQKHSNCKVKILNVKENIDVLYFLKNLQSLKNQPVLVEVNGKKQTMNINFAMTGRYRGSCGGYSTDGGDQYENRVDCFNNQKQLCAHWVSVGLDFVKYYPPCKAFY